jgi:chromosome segregation ATPase
VTIRTRGFMRWKDERDINLEACESFRRDVEHNLNLLKIFVNKKSLELQQSRQDHLKGLEDLNSLMKKIEKLELASSKLRHMSKKNNDRIQQIEQQKADQVKKFAIWQEKIKRLDNQLEEQDLKITEEQKYLSEQQNKLHELKAQHDGLEQKYLEGHKRLQQLDSQLNETLEKLEKRSKSWQDKAGLKAELNAKLNTCLNS